MPINSKASFAGWLDTVWDSHPPTLHAFDAAGLVDQAMDRSAQIRAIFDDYDTDTVQKPAGQ